VVQVLDAEEQRQEFVRMIVKENLVRMMCGWKILRPASCGPAIGSS
jgi:hypothetical protein